MRTEMINCLPPPLSKFLDLPLTTIRPHVTFCSGIMDPFTNLFDRQYDSMWLICVHAFFFGAKFFFIAFSIVLLQCAISCCQCRMLLLIWWQALSNTTASSQLSVSCTGFRCGSVLSSRLPIIMWRIMDVEMLSGHTPSYLADDCCHVIDTLTKRSVWLTHICFS